MPINNVLGLFTKLNPLLGILRAHSPYRSSAFKILKLEYFLEKLNPKLKKERYHSLLATKLAPLGKSLYIFNTRMHEMLSIADAQNSWHHVAKKSRNYDICDNNLLKHVKCTNSNILSIIHKLCFPKTSQLAIFRTMNIYRCTHHGKSCVVKNLQATSSPYKSMNHAQNGESASCPE